jgi:hypothetical protein
MKFLALCAVLCVASASFGAECPLSKGDSTQFCASDGKKMMSVICYGAGNIAISYEMGAIFNTGYLGRNAKFAELVPGHSYLFTNEHFTWTDAFTTARSVDKFTFTAAPAASGVKQYEIVHENSFFTRESAEGEWIGGPPAANIAQTATCK